ncbi:UDP-N-acetylmuramate dehydrogenase [Aspergillus udagawae]|uniref:UDP-N-acetylmuramate dehydrogenase n=1 Tax=Aspergillus udagawae TaxID=91492 RepID=A0A8H3NDH2_9EURO|nr:UDP-N-acetylmuramate dehydrogenase [Aspergillus udagawae]
MQISSLVSLALLSTLASSAVIHFDFTKRKSVDCQKIQVALSEAGAYYRGRLSGYYGQSYATDV